MVYSEEEKRRMDCLLEVFSDYVANSTEIDIAYSEKTGYIRIIIDEGADAVFFRIKDFEDMLIMFMDDVFMDFEESELCLNKQSENNYLLCAYEHLQKRLNALDKNKKYALKMLDEFYEYMKEINKTIDL